jgi:zinc finger SWIM domain-containing protein 3
LKDNLWSPAAAYTEADFLREMDELKGISPDAYNYLSKIDSSTWSRAWFSTFTKCDLIVNNLSECFNAWILKSRDLLIISMMEMLRKKLMKRYQKKREGISTMEGRICPKIKARLDEHTRRNNMW